MQLIDKPQPLLRKRHRHHTRTPHRHQRIKPTPHQRGHRPQSFMSAPSGIGPLGTG
jgi:hypothetical protein